MKQNGFRVSVIITSYNQKAYLVEALESVMSQTVKPYEIVVADDCSADGSRETVLNYAARYPGWIKALLQPQNVGIPKNRNAALGAVTGDFVSILDGDDRYLPRKVEAELDALRSCPAARCVYSDVRFIDAEDHVIGLRDRKVQPSGDVFSYVARGKFGILRSMLIDYPLLVDVGFLDERFPKYDGFEPTLRLSKKGLFTYITEPLVEVRLHSGGDTGRSTPRDYILDLEGIYRKMAGLITNLPLEERKQIAWDWTHRLWALRLCDGIRSGRNTRAIALSAKGMLRGYDFESTELSVFHHYFVG